MRLAELYNSSNSEQSFLKALENENSYSRKGEIAGLYGGKRKYRLKTLGFSKERLLDLNNKKSHSRINELHKNKSKNRDLDLEF